MQLVSIVIRTLNEEKHLPELLSSLHAQKLADDIGLEIVIIDSGSTDRTLQIAKQHRCRITHIQKEEFTFGRSLNEGSAFASGDVLVYVSGHCIPVGEDWLTKLVAPLKHGTAGYSYGRQVGRGSTKYSERKLFQKYYPETQRPPSTDIFCNNANAALSRKLWAKSKFDEEILALEDMELAKRLTDHGEKVAYVADAAVYHIHDETWGQTRRRYEREGIALREILPDVHVSFIDTIHYFVSAVANDSLSALREGCFWKEFLGIIKFRLAQFWGAYRGNHEHRRISQKRKYDYYYPNKTIGD
jgi:glycosyltransferase involved in cell wall biosynthesis